MTLVIERQVMRYRLHASQGLFIAPRHTVMLATGVVGGNALEGAVDRGIRLLGHTVIHWWKPSFVGSIQSAKGIVSTQ